MKRKWKFNKKDNMVEIPIINLTENIEECDSPFVFCEGKLMFNKFAIARQMAMDALDEIKLASNILFKARKDGGHGHIEV